MPGFLLPECPSPFEAWFDRPKRGRLRAQELSPGAAGIQELRPADPGQVADNIGLHRQTRHFGAGECRSVVPRLDMAEIEFG